MNKQSRRVFMEQGGKLVLGAILGGHVLAAHASDHSEHEHDNHGSDDSASKVATITATEELCASCEYWGGVRQIVADGKQVTGHGKGWCNNPNSHNYQKMTKPDAGPMPAWKRWAALP